MHQTLPQIGTYLSETHIVWSFLKKLLPSLKLPVGVWIKDQNLKDQIFGGSHLNRFDEYFQGVKHIQML